MFTLPLGWPIYRGEFLKSGHSHRGNSTSLDQNLSQIARNKKNSFKKLKHLYFQQNNPNTPPFSECFFAENMPTESSCTKKSVHPKYSLACVVLSRSISPAVFFLFKRGLWWVRKTLEYIWHHFSLYMALDTMRWCPKRYSDWICKASDNYTLISCPNPATIDNISTADTHDRGTK